MFALSVLNTQKIKLNSLLKKKKKTTVIIASGKSTGWILKI